MLQILIWGVGIILMGVGFLLLYATRAFPAMDVVTQYKCESCNRVHKGGAMVDRCECGGNFYPVRETVISDPQPSIYRYVAYLLIIAGPVLILLGNSQAAEVNNLIGW
ncbi:hypothetical protein [Desulfoscipio gibsoniae]